MTNSILGRGFSFALFWWVLADGRQDGWLFGMVAVLAATWASLKLLPPTDQRIHLAGLLGFLCFFLWNSIRGGIHVAGMALRGRTALRPGVLELPVMLPPGGMCILLVNVLNLMPGTLGVDLVGSNLRLHVLDERLPVVAEVRALEAVIKRLFGIE